MKREIKPLYAGIVIAIAVVFIGYFFYREVGNLGRLPPGAPGNPGPFSPGGAAVGKGGQPAASGPASGPPPGPRTVPPASAK